VKSKSFLMLCALFAYMWGKKKERPKPTTWYGKTWYFIWEEDSLASWIVNIILAFVIIKFIVYPGLGFVLGTDYPLVAVVSGSMEHRAVAEYDEQCNRIGGEGMYIICGKALTERGYVPLEQYWELCGDWYDKRGITEEQFAQFPFRFGFNKGDIMVLTSPNALKVGDVVVFQASQAYPIIHRVVAKNNGIIQTKGDHNAEQLTFAKSGTDETRILEEQLLGKAAFKIPYAGYVKIWAVDLICLGYDFPFCLAGC
jgi:signal peptidase I